MAARFLAQLASYAHLSEEECGAVQALIGPARAAPPDTELVTDGEMNADCHLLLDGQAFRHKTLPDGRRQIIAFLASGDLLDLAALHAPVDYSVTTLTPCRIAAIPRAKLLELMRARPAVAEAMWNLALVESATQRAWMVGMGRRTAHGRVAHLLCEVFLRLRRAGLAQGDRCRFPVTQNHLADAAGLSGVHTNRVLQALRASGLIATRGRELFILDWAGLAAAGEFDASYLRLPTEAAEQRPAPLRPIGTGSRSAGTIGRRGG